MNWNWHQRRNRLLLGAAVLACALALANPGAAHAAWPLRSAGSVTLGFGATYRAAEATSSSVHHGIDVSAAEGDRVLAPLAGRVTFAGRVPAAGGGQVRAVTIATSAGSLTLMPLSSASVAKGAELAEGDDVGVLAGDGDGSSAVTHVHVGLKRGDLYVDPLSVLSAPVASGAGVGASAEAEVPASAQAPVTAGAGATQPAHASPGARSPAGGSASASAAHGSASSAVRALRAAVPGARLAPGVSVGGASGIAAPAVAAGQVAGLSAAQARLALPAPSLHAASALVQPTASLGNLPARALAAVTAGARVAGLASVGVLAAVGCLWPLWRRQQEGSGEDCVSAVHEDVAAAVGR